MGIQDSRVYLSRQVNNILQVFGSNVKISGLDITINNNNKLINNKIASFTISPGKCIVDTTLHLFPTATTLELDVSPYDSSGYLMIVVSYKYIETLQQNRPIFKLLYVTSDGLDQLPDAWSPNRDGLILGVFKFNNHSPYDIELYHGSTISINGNVYTINPISDTIGCQHYLGGSNSEPNSDYNRWLLSNGDLYFDLVRKDLFIYNGWSSIETTFESDDNYNSGIILYTLTVTKSGTGIGTVISNPNGIDCGSTCSYQFIAGTNVTLTATPDISSIFDGWSGDVTDFNSTIIVTMISDKSVTATFNPKDVIKYTLTVTKSGIGTGTVTSPFSGISCRSTCSYQFVSGSTVSLIAIPDPSCAFGGWSGDVIDSSSTITFTMDSNKSVTATFNTLSYTLTVTKSGSGTGTITSNPAGINCGSTCSYQFSSGTSVTLTATPDSSSTFGGWSGDATGTSSTVTVTMNSNKNVTAMFNTLLYTLTVTKSGAGTGTVSSSPSGISCGIACSYQFTPGTNVTLTAIPDSSSTFGGWSGDTIGTSTTTTITMDSDKSVTATFNTLSYTLTVTKAGAGTGTVSSNPSGINCGSTCSYQFASGTNVTLTATPGSSSVFGGWSGAAVGTNTTTTITMDSNKSVTATFNTSSYTLTVTKSGVGTGTVTSSPSGINCGSICSYQFASGTSVTLTATPDSGSAFGGWSGDITGSSSTITVTMDSNKNVTATFTSSYTIIIMKSGRGSGTVTSNPSGINCGSICSYQFASGANVTLTAIPDSPSTFGGWSGAVTDTNTTVIVTMNSDKIITATFNVYDEAGYFAGGQNWNNSNSISQFFIDKLLFSDESRSTLSTTLSRSVYEQSACNSSLAGYFAGGYAVSSFIDKLLFSDESRSTLAAKLSQSVFEQSACNSTLSGYFAGGYNGSYQSYIDKLLFSNESRSTLTTTLSQSAEYQSACNSTLCGYFAGGDNVSNYTITNQNFIDKLLLFNGGETRSTLAATLSQFVEQQSACNSSIAGYFAGGYNYNTSGYYYSFIDKLSFSNDSRSTLVATLSKIVSAQSACNSTLTGYFAGGAAGNYYSFVDKLSFSNDSRTTLSATLSQSIRWQSTCQSGGIL
jgi:hypothetical protein